MNLQPAKHASSCGSTLRRKARLDTMRELAALVSLKLRQHTAAQSTAGCHA